MSDRSARQPLANEIELIECLVADRHRTRARVGIGIVGAEFTSFANQSRELSLERADRHCAQFDKRARITVKGDNAIQFECVYGVGKES